MSYNVTTTFNLNGKGDKPEHIKCWEKAKSIKIICDKLWGEMLSYIFSVTDLKDFGSK